MLMQSENRQRACVDWDPISLFFSKRKCIFQDEKKIDLQEHTEY